jgi:Fe-S-cluster-containing dehydrogenase component
MVSAEYGFFSESPAAIRESISNINEAGAFGFFIDPQRCIGCRSCVASCAECGTHRGHSMIHLDELDRSVSTQTGPTVCMHCEDPICAMSCPADAIKRSEDGVVHAAQKPRCVACQNCELSCPFGVPMVLPGLEQMLMCATVCPSQALLFAPRHEVASLRASQPLREFRIGALTVKTRNAIMVPDPEIPLNLDASLLCEGAL